MSSSMGDPEYRQDQDRREQGKIQAHVPEHADLPRSSYYSSSSSPQPQPPRLSDSPIPFSDPDPHAYSAPTEATQPPSASASAPAPAARNVTLDTTQAELDAAELRKEQGEKRSSMMTIGQGQGQGQRGKSLRRGQSVGGESGLISEKTGVDHVDIGRNEKANVNDDDVRHFTQPPRSLSGPAHHGVPGAATGTGTGGLPTSPTLSPPSHHHHHSLPLPLPQRSHTNDSVRSSRSRVEERLKRMTTGLFTPDRKINRPGIPGTWRSIRNVIFSNWLNVLLVFIPISWALHFAVGDKNDVAVFVTSFIAIIPLAALLGYTTETLALFTSQTIGGLLNATLGNAVELIVAILALIKCELQVVQSSLIGSILSNLLLVCGMCFFAGGTRFAEQEFSATASQLNSSLLLMAVIAVLIPSAFHFSTHTTATGDGVALTPAQLNTDLLAMSHGVAIILLLLYVGYLLFQLFTHADLYADPVGPTGSTRYPENIQNYPGTIAARIPMTRRYKEKKLLIGDGSDDSLGTTFNSNTTNTRQQIMPVMVDGGVRHAIAHVHGTSSALEDPVTYNAFNGAGGDVGVGVGVGSGAGAGARRRANAAAKTVDVDQEATVGLEPVGEGEDGADGEEEEEEETPQMNWQVCLGSMILITILVGVTAEWLVSSINVRIDLVFSCSFLRLFL